LIFIGHFSIEKNVISIMLFSTIRIAFATALCQVRFGRGECNHLSILNCMNDLTIWKFDIKRRF
jgi:hypothetical protein